MHARCVLTIIAQHPAVHSEASYRGTSLTAPVQMTKLHPRTGSLEQKFALRIAESCEHYTSVNISTDDTAPDTSSIGFKSLPRIGLTVESVVFRLQGEADRNSALRSTQR